MAKNKWEKVSEEEAKHHKLYGVGGWLLLFGVGMVLSFLKDFGGVNQEAYKAGLTVQQFLAYDHPAVSYVKAALAYDAFIAIAVIWMMIAKASFFRVAALILMLSILPMLVVLAAVTGFSEAGSGIGQTLIPWVIYCAVWGTYLFRSKRVRVTFEHMVIVGDKAKETAPPPSRKPVIPSVAPGPVAPNFRALDAPVSQVSTAPAPFVASSVDESAETVPEEQLWAAAIAEFECSARRPGLWAKFFAEAHGDETKAKVSYLNARVAEIRAEDEQRVLSVLHARAVAAEEARLAGLAAEQRAYELLPKGTCPNCGTISPLTVKSCPKCKASFDVGSVWALEPIPQTDAQASLHRAEEANRCG